MIKIRIVKTQKYSHSDILLRCKISKDKHIVFDLTNKFYIFIMPSSYFHHKTHQFKNILYQSYE